MENSRYIQAGRTGRAGSTAWSFVIAVALGVYGAAVPVAVHAQATVGNVFGWAPSGATITVHSTSGVRRHTKANTKGRYKLSLPMGIYTVALEKDGNPVDTRSNIRLTVGAGAEVDFACPQDNCAEASSSQ